MNSISLYKLFLSFLVYSFIGWVAEVIYCSSIQKRFINRGFLYGPICPVYGFGGLLVVKFLVGLNSFGAFYSCLLIFVCSFVLTSALEYVTSWIMEKLFSAKWWDYSHYKLNINGRVCLLNSTMFGFGGLIGVKVVAPLVDCFIGLFSEMWTICLFYGLATVLLVDMAFTLHSLIDFRTYIVHLEEFRNQIKDKIEQKEWIEATSKIVEELFYNAKEHSALLTAEVIEKIEHFKKKDFRHNRFIKNFPTIRSAKFNHSIEHIRNYVSRFKK